LQALLDANSARTFEELAEALNIGKSFTRNEKHLKRKQFYMIIV